MYSLNSAAGMHVAGKMEPVPSPSTQVEDACQRLSILQGETLELVRSVASRLGPVLNPCGGSAKSEGDAPKPVRCSLADRIHSAADQEYAVILILRGFLADLEL